MNISDFTSILIDYTSSATRIAQKAFESHTPLILSISISILTSLGYAFYHHFKIQQQPKSESRKKFDARTHLLPKEERWRLFIDWKKQTQPERGGHFDLGEPGYRSGMERAHRYLRDIIGTEMTPKIYCKIHDLCIKDVKKNKAEDGQSSFFKSGFAPRGTQAYPFDQAPNPDYPNRLYATEKAINEGLSKNLFTRYTGRYSDYPDYIDPSKLLGRFTSEYMHPSVAYWDLEIIENKIADMFREYYHTVNQEQDRDIKLGAIVDLCRKLEIAHVFSDGNQRTISFNLLYKLLLENGFSLTILEHPDLFDGFCTTAQMVEQVKQGMDRFSALCEYFKGDQEIPIDTFIEELNEKIHFEIGS